METQNPLKHRLSRMFRSSFASCKSRDISDIVDPPINRPHYQLIELFSPKPSPSIFRTKSTEKAQAQAQAQTELFPRPKVSDRNSLLTPANADGRNSPPASPTSPLTTFLNFQQSKPKPRSKKSKKKTNKRTHLRKSSNFESFDNYYDWFSSDEDDDDETTLFSSKSLSSDSSDSFRRKKPNYRRKKVSQRENEMGLMPLGGKVKDSFAVVKRSSDPYSDFRVSMVEMIVERQIFGARDLENLLQTFLSLNSHHHHRVIVEVFTEICDALFSNWS